MIFNYDKFIKGIYEEYKGNFTIDEIKKLLNVMDEYDKDTPISTGKRLSLTRISIKGQKSSGEEISLTLPFQNGVNLIIADNFKGKSSLFKMIQIALTGNNKLKSDVKKWINLINLRFKINEKNYSAIIRFENSRLKKGSLYSRIIDELNETEEYHPVFEANGASEYEKYIKEFFFNQFSYYSLKWTQKASQKDKNELNEAKASWKTYFKSIYLESKDSSSLMYGGQGKKVFQMLLGLELTYAINALSVKFDMLTFNKAKQDEISNNKEEQGKDEKSALEKRKYEIDKEIANLNIKPGRLNQLYESYKMIIKKINYENSLVIENGKHLNERSEELNSLSAKITSYTNEMNRMDKEINKTVRFINDIEEYIEVGIFFANLNIKYCPSCNHKVSTINTNSDHECLLCHETIVENYNDINKEIYNQKINELKDTKYKLIQEKNIIKNLIGQLKKEYDKVNQSSLELRLMLETQDNTSILKEQLSDIEIQINREKININDERKMELTAEKAVIEYRLSDLSSESLVNQQNRENRKIDIIKQSIQELNRFRYENSTNVLKYLSDIMLSELHNFGLKSISEIKITENFDVLYKQDGEYISFEDIAEGEQLRAKIAFYLALIQLDIEHNFGRHTRFLIIDSPSKEEGDSQYLNGLSKTLKDIDNRYGDNLQVIIGTAERKLVNSVKNEMVFEEGVYLF